MALSEVGAGALFLVEYVPVKPGTEDLAIGPEERKRLLAQDRFTRLPYPVATLPGDEEAYGGCLAAGRGFIHISDDGRLEACPFAPYSDSSVADGNLAEALRSPMMAAIRERHGELVETKGGCALWNKEGWAVSLGACAEKRSGKFVAA
jgi:MoaA/NifB/PqqE/SkfB family radical SAM enzyme